MTDTHELVLTEAERKQILAQREAAERERKERARPHWPYVMESPTPHFNCGGVVRYYEVNDYADLALRCDKCGKHWAEYA